MSTNIIATFQDQGGRHYMEDKIDVVIPFYEDYEYYAVFDGHGGSDVVSFVQSHMKDILFSLLQTMIQRQYCEEEILYHAFKKVVEVLPAQFSKRQGTTVVIVLRKGHKLWVANCGDSRAIAVLNNGKVIELTYDHKPYRQDEYFRIKSAGGYVAPSFKGDVYRVNGSLAVSRSVGDFELYPHVTWKPEISLIKITHQSFFVVLATDGLWDVIDNEEVAHILLHSQKCNIEEDIGNVLCSTARKRGSSDNFSLIIVKLNNT